MIPSPALEDLATVALYGWSLGLGWASGAWLFRSSCAIGRFIGVAISNASTQRRS